MENKATIWITVAAVVLLVGGGFALLASERNADRNHGDTSQHPANTDGDGDKKVATNSVTIENFAYSPATITVKKGTTVTWTNKDDVAHTVTERDDKPGPNSGNLERGESYSYTYDTVGTFGYYCVPHPGMVGTVTVTE